MSFAFELGRAAAKRRNAEKREQVEPLLGGEFLAEWRRGYGGEGKLYPKRSDSTAATAESRSSAAVSAGTATATVSVTPPATKPAKQAALFDAGEPEKLKPAKAVKPAEPKAPTPVPLTEIDQEIALLVGIGIGLTEADELVRKGQWTLDQLVCQWKIGNEAGLPQNVIGRVARYGQQRWGEALASKE